MIRKLDDSQKAARITDVLLDNPYKRGFACASLFL